MLYSSFKPCADIFFALLGLVILSPILLITSILLLTGLRGNPFFVQRRPGKNEKIFRLIKFRTMTNDRDKNGILLPDEDRITKLGSIVRNLSLDEIPQLFNVLKGDMSLIGPRPLLPEYLPLYNKEQIRRHEVRPGITGWAQVNGRNAINWEQKFELDVWYVDNLSFLLDLKIFLLTILIVTGRSGISSDSSVTMEKFKGSL